MQNQITVMIVDDNRTNLSLMDLLVRKLPNCNTLLFDHPRKVMDSVKTLNFDIAVIDYQMPDLNGIELIQRLRLAQRSVDRRSAGGAFDGADLFHRRRTTRSAEGAAACPG